MADIQFAGNHPGRNPWRDHGEIVLGPVGSVACNLLSYESLDVTGKIVLVEFGACPALALQLHSPESSLSGSGQLLQNSTSDSVAVARQSFGEGLEGTRVVWAGAAASILKEFRGGVERGGGDLIGSSGIQQLLETTT